MIDRCSTRDCRRLGQGVQSPRWVTSNPAYGRHWSNRKQSSRFIGNRLLILFRYLVKEVLVTTLAVAFTLLVIVISSRLVGYLSLAAEGSLAPGVLFEVILYRIPGFLQLILPLAFFVSVLLSLGRMYVDSEITVMSACGISQRRILAIILAPALFIAAIVAYTSLFLSPYTAGRVESMLNQADTAGGLDLLVAGRFRYINEGRGRVTYVEQMDKQKHEMLGVFATDSARDQTTGVANQVVILAARGRTKTDPESGDQFLVLSNGTRYLGQPGALGFQKMDFAEMGQRLQPREADVAPRKRDTVPTSQLLSSHDPIRIATLQWRLSLPLLVLVAAIAAVALARTDHRRGRYGKLFPAFILFLVYFLVLSAARDAVGKERLDTLVGMWWVHAVFFALGMTLMFGGQFWRSWRVRRQLRA